MAAKRKGVIHFTRIEPLRNTKRAPGVVYSLPFVLIVEGEYPRSLEVQIKELPAPGVEPEQLEVVVPEGQSIPFSLVSLTAMALDFYGASSHSTRPRTYPVDLA